MYGTLKCRQVAGNSVPGGALSAAGNTGGGIAGADLTFEANQYGCSQVKVMIICPLAIKPEFRLLAGVTCAGWRKFQPDNANSIYWKYRHDKAWRDPLITTTDVASAVALGALASTSAAAGSPAHLFARS